MTTSRETCSYPSFQRTWYRIDFHNNNFQIQLFFSLSLLLNIPVIKDENIFFFYPNFSRCSLKFRSKDIPHHLRTFSAFRVWHSSGIFFFSFNSSKNKQANFLILYIQFQASSCVAWLHGFGIWCPLTVTAFPSPTQTLQPVSNHFTFPPLWST